MIRTIYEKATSLEVAFSISGKLPVVHLQMEVIRTSSLLRPLVKVPCNKGEVYQ